MEKYTVKLTAEERINLLSLIKVGKASANKLIHARIVLAADECDNLINKKTDNEIAKELHVSPKTVARTRQRFVEEGLELSLARKPHSRSKTRKIDGEQEAHLIALCCSNPPEGRANWTLKLLTNQLIEMEIIDDVSPTTVGRTLKKTN